MSDMLVRYDGSYVVSVSGSGIVVVGGAGGEHLNDVQVFDGESHTWHRGTPSLPQPCSHMPAVIYGDLVFVMGGFASLQRTPPMPPNLKYIYEFSHISTIQQFKWGESSRGQQYLPIHKKQIGY